ncbi:hypothetical protein Thiowin_01754 [Thiorhodovibrio winogradskyi]|uniref:L,D-TPase catalytic domain-containing protein n=1 Tax=Thiorhodovibrio winogradskyi TaxID=77007 RepID=A0ABZ0SB41_9GAMM|nr:L,D-transpeptidase [Thiorhodovibrio winogradskyi]
MVTTVKQPWIISSDDASVASCQALAARLHRMSSAAPVGNLLGRLKGFDPKTFCLTGYTPSTLSHKQGRLSTCLHKHLIRMALYLGLSLLGVGCVPHQIMTGDNLTNIANPMFDTAYSEDADVAFVVDATTAAAHKSGKVNFRTESASRRTRDLAHWIVSSRDNLNLPFAIVDKVNAKVYVFEIDGKLYGAAPVLLGLARGDHSIPDIGNKPLSHIPPADRTTPAGRFVSVMGRNHKGKDILWLDYEQALSMHAVVKGRPQDRRAHRLATPTPLDNRISFGCINVPVDAFRTLIKNKFSGAGGVVYILPENKTGAKA